MRTDNLNLNNGRFARRHGTQPEAWWPMISKLRWLTGKRALPDHALCDAFGAALHRGDALMDAVVVWMEETGMDVARPLLLQAIDQGIASLNDPPNCLVALFAQVDTPPDWLDRDKLERGWQAMHLLGDSLTWGLRDFILMGGYLSSSINEVLALSGGLKAGPVKRLAETSQWVMDITEPGGLDRDGPGFRSSLRVRWVHALLRHSIAGRPDWNAQEHGLPVNQTDMVATWTGFSIGGLLSAMLLGKLVLKPADMHAYLHLMKYAHYLMGVEEQFLSDQLGECAWLMANNTLTQAGPSPVCRDMAHALANYQGLRQYQRLSWLQGRWHRHVQLSRSRYFLGKKAMQQLGLSTAVPPWYPLATLPFKAVGSVLTGHVLPGQRQRQMHRGRQQQIAFVDGLYRGLDRAFAPERMTALA